MAPILLIETKSDGNEEDAELEDLAGKVRVLLTTKLHRESLFNSYLAGNVRALLST